MSGSVQGDGAAEYESDNQERSQSLPIMSDNWDDIISQYKCLLPDYLQEDHVDILILNAPGDESLARKLESCINELTFPIKNIVHQGKAVLLDEAVVYVRSRIEQLDEAIKYSTVTCAILSPEFLTTEEYRHTGCASFWNTTQDESKKNCFLLAFDCPRTSLKGKIPKYFDQLKTSVDISLPDEDLRRVLHKQIGCFLNERLKRDLLQKRERIIYLRSNSVAGFDLSSEFDLPSPGVSTNDILSLPDYNEPSLDEGFQSGSMRSFNESDYVNSAVGGFNATDSAKISHFTAHSPLSETKKQSPLANTSSILNKGPIIQTADYNTERNLDDENENKVDPTCNPWLFVSVGMVMAAVIVGVVYSR